MVNVKFGHKVIHANNLYYPVLIINDQEMYCSSQGKIVSFDTEKDAIEYLKED